MRLMTRPLPCGAPALVRAAMAGLAALALAGCNGDPDEQAPACPQAFLSPDAATLTRYDGHGTDLTNLVLSGRLTDIKGACRGLLGHREITARAHVEMVLTRGPAARGRAVDVPYNVAVVHDGQVLEKQQFVQHVVFPPNVETVQVTGQEVKLKLQTRRGLTGPSYAIYFVFELTPAELAANQRAQGQ